MKKVLVFGLALLLLVAFGGCAVENRVVAKKAWDVAPDEISIISELNTKDVNAQAFKGYTDKWLTKLLQGYKFSIVDGSDLKLTYTVDVLEPGNRWVRWMAGVFGAGQGYVQGTVTIRQKGVAVGEYDFAAVQRGGFFGGTIEDLAREAAYGIASKINKKNFDEKLYDREKK